MEVLSVLAEMSAKASLGFGYPLGLGLAGLGNAVNGAMNAMGRQPDSIPAIQTAMIIGCAFIDAVAIFALISVFLTGGLQK